MIYFPPVSLFPIVLYTSLWLCSCTISVFIQCRATGIKESHYLMGAFAYIWEYIPIDIIFIISLFVFHSLSVKFKGFIMRLCALKNQLLLYMRKALGIQQKS